MHRILITFLFSTALLSGGCATHSRTVNVDTPVVHQQHAQILQDENSTDLEDQGMLDATVDVVGNILALPFRAVAALFKAFA
jgi:hypothetical protein